MQYNRNENTFIHFTCNATRRSCLVCVSGLRQKEFPYSIFHFRRRRPAAVCSGWHAVAARALPQLNPKRILYFFYSLLLLYFLVSVRARSCAHSALLFSYRLHFLSHFSFLFIARVFRFLREALSARHAFIQANTAAEENISPRRRKLPGCPI